ncbi:MAG: TldD/PmbA family protein [Thermoplasmatales archaeon]
MEEFVDKSMSYASKGSKFVEASYSSSKKNVLLMKNGTVSASGYSRDSGLALRILDNSISFLSSNTKDWTKLKDDIDGAIKRSKLPGRNKLSDEKAYVDSWAVEEKRKIEDVAISEKAEILKELDSKLIMKGIQMRILSLSDNIDEGVAENTEGTSIRWRLPKVSFFAMIGYLGDGNYEQGTIELGYSGGYEALDQWNLTEKVEREADVLKKATTAHHIGEGTYDLIAGPEISGIVAHESAGHPSEADRILGREMAQAGESFIRSEDRGMRVGSDVVNLVDDPTIEHSFGFYKYDRDGVPARKRYLYRNGLVNEFLQNRESAGRTGEKSNGASRSSEWDKEPLVRMSTTYIEPGRYTSDELIEGVKQGIYMKSFTEWNIDDIRFNEKYVGREAYLIENGEIKQQIRRPVIETTTIKFYSSIDAVGKDLEFYAGTCGKGDPMQGVDVWMGGPHIRLRGVYVR